jgi:hypothetical protein
LIDALVMEPDVSVRRTRPQAHRPVCPFHKTKDSIDAMQLTFSDILTPDDVKRHIPHHFDLPPGCMHLTIRLTFEPAMVGDIRNLLTLTLFDPAGFRGAGHRGGNEHVVTIDADNTTPGYAPGPLPSGRWTVQIDTHMVLPGEPCRYQLDISADAAADSPEQGLASKPAPALPSFAHVANPNPGWYRGDLHAHTIHSDADWNVPDLVAAARERGLDFVTLTDHNTVSGLTEMEAHAADGFLTMGGMELTTFWGHAVCLGVHEWIDWRVTRDGPEMEEIAARLMADDHIYIIAHPKNRGDPFCTGCRWVYPGMMPGPARLVEVWNEFWAGKDDQNSDKNVDGLALWYEWLNRGLRIVATAGSDVHRSAGYADSPGFNMVYAEELSEWGILRALAQGHLYLSSGPTLDFTATDADGTQVMMGDLLTLDRQSASVRLASTWSNAPAGARIRLVADGEVLESLTIDDAGTLGWTISTQQIDWCTLEMRDDDDNMLALTNPIFFAPHDREAAV